MAFGVFDLIKKGYKSYCVVLNTDKCTGQGIHWLCLFCDFRTSPFTIEYFNSSGNKPVVQVQRWMTIQNNNIKIALSDPYGSGLYNYYQKGEMKSEGNSITEGIGQGRITKNLENCPVDMSFRIDDNQALTIIFDLLKEEGLFLGGSSGINVAGAIKLAKELGPGHTIVTILCDSGQRYQSKIWNPSFLKSKDLTVPHWL